MDDCESDRASEAPGASLDPTERNDGTSSGTHTRVRGRSKSPTPTRFPSSNTSGTSATQGSSPRRAASVEKRRQTVSSSPWGPSVVVHGAFVNLGLAAKRVFGSKLTDSLWPSRMRTPSAPLQSDTPALPITKKENLPPEDVADRTFNPSSNASYKQATMSPTSSKDTLERMRTPLKGKNVIDQSENLKTMDGLHVKLIDQHRWPSSTGFNSLNKNSNLPDESMKTSSTSDTSVVGPTLGRISLPNDTTKPLQEFSSDSAMFLSSSIDDGKSKIDELQKLSTSLADDDKLDLCSHPSEKTASVTPIARSHSLTTAESQPVSPNKSYGPSRGVSPSYTMAFNPSATKEASPTHSKESNHSPVAKAVSPTSLERVNPSPITKGASLSPSREVSPTPNANGVSISLDTKEVGLMLPATRASPIPTTGEANHSLPTKESSPMHAAKEIGPTHAIKRVSLYPASRGASPTPTTKGIRLFPAATEIDLKPTIKGANSTSASKEINHTPTSKRFSPTPVSNGVNLTPTAREVDHSFVTKENNLMPLARDEIPTSMNNQVSPYPTSFPMATEADLMLVVREVNSTSTTKGISHTPTTKGVGSMPSSRGVSPMPSSKGASPTLTVKEVNHSPATKEINHVAIAREPSPTFVTKGVSTYPATRGVNPNPTTKGVHLFPAALEVDLMPTIKGVNSTSTIKGTSHIPTSIGFSPMPATRGVSPTLAAKVVCPTSEVNTVSISTITKKGYPTHGVRGVSPNLISKEANLSPTAKEVNHASVVREVTPIPSVKKVGPTPSDKEVSITPVTRGVSPTTIAKCTFREVSPMPAVKDVSSTFIAKGAHLSLITREVDPTHITRAVSPTLEGRTTNPNSITPSNPTQSSNSNTLFISTEIGHSPTKKVGIAPVKEVGFELVKGVQPSLNTKFIDPSPAIRGASRTPSRGINHSLATRGVSLTPIIRGVSLTPSTKAIGLPRATRGVSLTPVRPSGTRQYSNSNTSNPPSRGVSPVPKGVGPRARGVSPTPTRSSGPRQPYNSNTISIFAKIDDSKKGRKVANHIEYAQYLQLLYNIHLQWQVINANVEAALDLQQVTNEESLFNVWRTISELRDSVAAKKLDLDLVILQLKLYVVLNRQMTHMDEWASIQKEHESALSSATRDIEARILRLPITGGAKADIKTLKLVVSSTMQVIQTMVSSIQSTLSKLERIHFLASELATVASYERAFLDECEILLASATPLQVEEYSLRTHLIQSNQACNSE